MASYKYMVFDLDGKKLGSKNSRFEANKIGLEATGSPDGYTIRKYRIS